MMKYSENGTLETAEQRETREKFEALYQEIADLKMALATAPEGRSNSSELAEYICLQREISDLRHSLSRAWKEIRIMKLRRGIEEESWQR